MIRLYRGIPMDPTIRDKSVFLEREQSAGFFISPTTAVFYDDYLSASPTPVPSQTSTTTSVISTIASSLGSSGKQKPSIPLKAHYLIILPFKQVEEPCELLLDQEKTEDPFVQLIKTPKKQKLKN